MLNPRTREWANDLLSSIGVPTHIFPEIVASGTRLGDYQGIPVITPASHDTGSAVAGIPASTPSYAYICSGTWSLVGIEIDKPIINKAAMEANATNEGGAYDTIRLLKNNMGLWLVQQCCTTWAKEGNLFDYGDLESLAMTAPPLVSFVNPDDSMFLPPGNHQKRIQNFCLETNQNPPQTEGETIRCILESLAMAYCDALQKILRISGQKVQVIHMVGGGSKNNLLNQMTANATGIPVIAGPVEASAIGNSIVQLIALGELKDRQEARALVLEKLPVRIYEPKETDKWEDAYYRYQKIVSG
jgi:rhamnulokinase